MSLATKDILEKEVSPNVKYLPPWDAEKFQGLGITKGSRVRFRLKLFKFADENGVIDRRQLNVPLNAYIDTVEADEFRFQSKLKVDRTSIKINDEAQILQIDFFAVENPLFVMWGLIALAIAYFGANALESVEVISENSETLVGGIGISLPIIGLALLAFALTGFAGFKALK